MLISACAENTLQCLNESPSKKEGKCSVRKVQCVNLRAASMKVPPKRKGNRLSGTALVASNGGLNESPSQKKGNLKREGLCRVVGGASMKVPPKRKGNLLLVFLVAEISFGGLNESPSQKEGKSPLPHAAQRLPARPQ